MSRDCPPARLSPAYMHKGYTELALKSNSGYGMWDAEVKRIAQRRAGAEGNWGRRTYPFAINVRFWTFRNCNTSVLHTHTHAHEVCICLTQNCSGNGNKCCQHFICLGVRDFYAYAWANKASKRDCKK